MIIEELVHNPHDRMCTMRVRATGDELRNIDVHVASRLRHHNLCVDVHIYSHIVELMVSKGYINIEKGNDILAFAGIEKRIVGPATDSISGGNNALE